MTTPTLREAAQALLDALATTGTMNDLYIVANNLRAALAAEPAAEPMPPGLLMRRAEWDALTPAAKERMRQLFRAGAGALSRKATQARAEAAERTKHVPMLNGLTETETAAASVAGMRVVDCVAGPMPDPAVPVVMLDRKPAETAVPVVASENERSQ